MLYKDIIEDVCGKEWNGAGRQSRQSAYGVAIVMSFINGVSLDLNSLSKHLKINREDLRGALNNLSSSGIFLDAVGLKEDSVLQGRAFSPTSKRIDDFTLEQSAVAAWCHIAGVACGAIKRNYWAVANG